MDDSIIHNRTYTTCPTTFSIFVTIFTNQDICHVYRMTSITKRHNRAGVLLEYQEVTRCRFTYYFFSEQLSAR